MSTSAHNRYSRFFRRPTRATILLLTTAFALAACGGDATQAGPIIIDADGPSAAWGKAVGDVNGDGLPDVIVGGHRPRKFGFFARIANKLGAIDLAAVAGELVWYENPSWRRHPVSDRYHFRTDVALGDIDVDGSQDIVALTDEGVVLFRGPEWSATMLPTGGRLKFHDVELADLDGDGDTDIVLRNQSRFGYDDGDALLLLFHQGAGWSARTLQVPRGEGLDLADLDGDAFADIVVNDVWLRNPGRDAASADWAAVDYMSDYDWPDVVIAVADINGDGMPDIAVSPAEPDGERYRLSWFEAPADPEAGWREHVVDADIETVHHALGAGDFDGDGDTDIFSAQMNQGEDPDAVKVYLQQDDDWRRILLGTQGSHNLQVADFDGDGDVEFIGANWQFDDATRRYAVTLWDDSLLGDDTGRWSRFRIGDNGERRNLFVRVGDIDGDGLPDVAAGRSWFRNPGRIDGHWQRRVIGDGLQTVLLLADVDGDDVVDVIGCNYDGRLVAPGLIERARAKLAGSGYPGASPCTELRWGRNNGAGRFDISAAVARLVGDYPQGATIHEGATSRGIVLSWHKSGLGLQRYAIPQDVSNTASWAQTDDIAFSQDEQLSSVDVNGDGRQDLVTGTFWLDAGSTWHPSSLAAIDGLPDRHVVDDVNGDGRADLVVGFEAVSQPGDLLLIDDVFAAAGKRSERVIDRPTGPMSLAVADIDGDGAPEVLVGEHNTAVPGIARLLAYRRGPEGAWLAPDVLSVGDEHHNGVVPVDLDRDGDLDIVSIGWTHSGVLVFENPGTE